MSLKILNSHALNLAGAAEEAFSDDIVEADASVAYWRKVSVESHGKPFTVRVFTAFSASRGLSNSESVSIDLMASDLYEQLSEHYAGLDRDKGYLVYSRTKSTLELRGHKPRVDAYSIKTPYALTERINSYVQNFVDTAIDLLLNEGLIREKQSKRSRA